MAGAAGGEGEGLMAQLDLLKACQRALEVALADNPPERAQDAWKSMPGSTHLQHASVHLVMALKGTDPAEHDIEHAIARLAMVLALEEEKNGTA